MKRKDLVEMIEKLKVCIDVGHDFEFVESWSMSGRPSRIEWKCKKCDFTKETEVTEEQEHILMKYKSLNIPEKAKNPA